MYGSSYCVLLTAKMMCGQGVRQRCVGVRGGMGWVGPERVVGDSGFLWLRAMLKEERGEGMGSYRAVSSVCSNVRFQPKQKCYGGVGKLILKIKMAHDCDYPLWRKVMIV